MVATACHYSDGGWGYPSRQLSPAWESIFGKNTEARKRDNRLMKIKAVGQMANNALTAKTI